MRHIGSHDDQKVHKFIDFLVASGIEARADVSEKSGFDIWIIEEDDLEQAKPLFDEFKKSPDDPKYAKATPKAAQLRAQAAKRLAQTQKNVVRVNNRSLSRRPPFSLFLIVACCLIFVATDFGFNENTFVFRAVTFMSAPEAELLASFRTSSSIPILMRLLPSDWQEFALASYNLRNGEVWRTITPIFLHASFRHLIFNMLGLVFFGFVIERKEGTRFLILLVLVSAFASNLLQGLVPTRFDGAGVGSSLDSQYIQSYFGGISGVVYAMLGFIWMRGSRSFVPEYQLSTLMIILMFGSLLLGVTGMDTALLQVNMANWCHVIGLLVGVTAGYLGLGKTAK